MTAPPTTTTTDRHAGADPAEILQAAEILLRLPYTCWHYGDSVAFEGLLAATDATGDARFAGFAHGFARGWAARDPDFRKQDNTAPGLAMVRLAERTGDGILLEAVARLADALCERRLVGGAYAAWEHSPLRQPYGPQPLPPEEAALVRDAGPGIFVDCLHFDPPFFAALGRVARDPTFTARAVEQALAYISLLQEPERGLFFHFWLEKTGRPHILGWGRGQGWALLGPLDTLEEIRDARVDAVNRERIEEAARRLAAAMRDGQRPDGHWYTVAHDETSGDETSTAAFMATAFMRGMRMGYLDVTSTSLRLGHSKRPGGRQTAMGRFAASAPRSGPAHCPPTTPTSPGTFSCRGARVRSSSRWPRR